MWRIIKAEFDYFKAPLFMVWGFFILLCAVSPYIVNGVNLDRHPLRGSEFFAGLVLWTFLLHLVFVLVQMAYEFHESRVRRVSQLPTSLHAAGMARVFTPLMFFIMNILLILVCWEILTLMYPKSMASAEYFGKILFIPLTDLEGNMLIVLTPIGIWLSIVLALRLLSEWQGRVLVSVGIGCVFIYSILLRFISYKLYLIIKDILYTITRYPVDQYVFVIILPLILLVLLYVFFMTRRSYASG